jgi:hypothetical protein
MVEQEGNDKSVLVPAGDSNLTLYLSVHGQGTSRSTGPAACEVTLIDDWLSFARIITPCHMEDPAQEPPHASGKPDGDREEPWADRLRWGNTGAVSDVDPLLTY